MAEVARCCGKTEVIDSMNRQDLSLGPVEMTGAFTKRKEKRVNANTYQEGWIGACQQSCVWVMDSRRAFESRLKHRVELGESGSNGT